MEDRTLLGLVLDKIAEVGQRPAAVAAAVENGVVSLYGEASSASDRLALEAACLSLPGARAVVQHLRVRPPDAPADDRRIALAAIEALDRLETLKGCRIGLSVAEGVVTLRGEVEADPQRIAAEQRLRAQPEVANVHNLLALRSQAAAGDVAGWVREAVARQDLRIQNFAVEACGGGLIRLSGQTDSWFARDAAERTAWSAPGVRAVDNGIALPATAVDPNVEWSGMPEE